MQYTQEMAKINLNYQQNQENSSIVLTLGSLGVLLCMVITVLGIKLWWFKHRLSFDQTTTQNAAAGGDPPAVVIPRRNKKPKYKDKRWSQQISENVEVHGVFRHKAEDDMDIQRPQHLPPVRIRHPSASTQSLILPPPRNKREQAHSTAFEDMEIGTPLTLTPTSSLTAIPNTNDSNTKLSLTFEEFEKQFKLKEIKPENQEIQVTHEVIEIPVPPLRLNRSSSAMQNPEKTQRFLKSSRSITVPEFHKVKERRPTGFSRPTEDLTRIDDYDEIKLFENFGERRPTGYIKYDDVDGDLTDQYERDLNQQAYLNRKDKLDDYTFTENGNWKRNEELESLESLRNENIVYQNDFNANPEVIDFKKDHINKEHLIRSIKQDEFLRRTYTEDFKEEKMKEIEISHQQGMSKQKENIEIPVEYEYDHSSEQLHRTGYIMNEEQVEVSYKSVKDRRPTEFVRDLPAEFTNDDIPSLPDDFDNQFSNWPQFEEKIETPKVNVRKFDNHDFERQTSIEESENQGNKSQNNSLTFNLTDSAHNDKYNMEKTSLNQRRSTAFEKTLTKHDESTDLSENEKLEKSSPTQKLLYSQLRSLMTEDTSKESLAKPEETKNSKNKLEENNQAENHQVTFEYSNFDKNKNEWNEISFVRKNKEGEEDMERSLTFDFTKDKDYDNPTQNQRRPTGYKSNNTEYFGEDEIFQSKVKFKDSNSPDKDYEKYSLSQRRPTGFIRNLQTQEDSDDYEEIFLNDLHETKVKFSDNILDTQKDTEMWSGKQRRPTGYIRKAEVEEFSNDISNIKVTFKESTDSKDSEYDFENFLVKQRRPTGYIKKSEIEDNEFTDFKESESNSEYTSIKQRRPTGFAKELYTEDITFENLSNDIIPYEKDNMEILKTTVPSKDVYSENFSDFPFKHRKSTDFVTTPDIEKLFDAPQQVNFNLNNLTQHQDENNKENEALKTRRPTGYVRNYDIQSVENLDQSQDIVDPLWQELEKDLDYDFAQNIDEEFTKIRHSYELNEGDFLELKNDLSPTVNIAKDSLGFGKTIEDDWKSFEKLKTPKTLRLKGEEQTEIQVTYKEELNTTSILKETKIENSQEKLDIIEVEEVKAKPRKSKVTFDFKTEEHLIPARSTRLDTEENAYYEDNSEYDDDNDEVYAKPPPSIPPPPPPPQPRQRLSNIKYNSELSSSSSVFTPVVSNPTSITLFGSQVSQEHPVEEDSWSAIRKHRNLTEEFQHITLDSSTPSSPPPKYNTAPPKPAYRNPLAQLAIQRAKEVKTEMGNFKARSIKDVRKQPEASKRNQQKFLNLHNDDFYDTEA